MRLHLTALTVALAVLPAVAAAPAHAVTCPLVADPAGDAFTGGSYLPIPTTPNADIVAVDVASGATTVAAVMRVASLDPDLFDRFGPEWVVAWRINGNEYVVRTRRTAHRDFDTRFQVNQANAGPVPVAFDLAADTITWTIPRTLLPDLATPGATFTTFRSFTSVLSSTTDTAVDLAVTYVDQTAGCVPAA